jgi:hypothetical protein
MTTLTLELNVPELENVAVSEDSLSVALTDGRRISVPLAWYPRLFHASKKERQRFRIIGNGEGIHWPEIDEDISVENILSGKISAESPQSFERWLKSRKNRLRKGVIKSVLHKH